MDEIKNINILQPIGRTRMRGMILMEHYVVSMFLVKREQEDNKVCSAPLPLINSTVTECVK